MPDNEEYIELYFTNQLDAAEKAAFEQRCVGDEAFTAEVAAYLMSRAALREKLLDGKQQRWTESKAAGDPPPVRPFTSFSIRKWLPYAAAACLVLSLGLYFLYPSSQPQQLAARYFNQHLLQLSQTMNASRDSMQKGIAVYNNRDYAKALQIFKNLRQSHPDQTDPIKYIGHVYLATKDYDNALKYFDTLAMAKDEYSNPGMFLKATTLLMRNEKADKAAAKKLLEEVVRKKEEGSQTATDWLQNW